MGVIFSYEHADRQRPMVRRLPNVRRWYERALFRLSLSVIIGCLSGILVGGSFWERGLMGWSSLHWPCGHDMMLERPEQTARFLESLSEGAGAG